MKKVLGILCILLGLAALAYAGYTLLHERQEAASAGEAAASLLEQMKQAMQAGDGTEASLSEATPAPDTGEASPSSEADASTTPLPDPFASPDADPSAEAASEASEGAAAKRTARPTATPEPDMPEMTMDGDAYIGYLEMPSIGISLPVMSHWSYAGLKKAPGRYFGNIQNSNIVIVAHNYAHHFGRLSLLEVGDAVQFVDAEGTIYRYKVEKLETLDPYDTSSLVSYTSGMTLATCTSGGERRVVVRLKRVLAYAQ